MKKKIWFSMFAAGLFLLAACNNTTGQMVMPTEAVATGTPGPTEAVLTEHPATLTPTAEPTEQPGTVPTPTEKPDAIPTLTEIPATPTKAPDPAETSAPTEPPAVVPTEEPTTGPTESPAPTAEPTPSPTAEPTLEPTVAPTEVPEPTVNPESLVAKGWQKTISIDEAYAIIFPELFRDAYVSKTDRELLLGYTSAEDAEIGFYINYIMKQTLEEALAELEAEGGFVLRQLPENGMVYYRLHIEDRIWQGVFVEEQYTAELLGAGFSEGTQTTGIMNVTFSYPADREEEYQKEEYSYYVVPLS